MIEITKDGHHLTVTKGAYLNYYKDMGYEAARASRKLDMPSMSNDPGEAYSGESEDSSQLKTDEEGFIGDSPEDLKKMDLGELYEYADELGIDYKGIRNKTDMRNLIREHLSAE